MLSIVFYMTQQGKYEVHLTVKAVKGRVILAKDIAFLVGKCIGRTMIPRQGERLVIGGEYGTIACVEGAKFQTLQGIARIGKGLEQISGDTFLMKDLPGGRKGIALSDGMGSGEEAFRGQYDGGRNVRRTVRGRIPGRDGGADDEYGAGDRKGRSEILHTGCMSV